MTGILNSMIGSIEQMGHTGKGTTNDADALRELQDNPPGTYDAVWFGPPVPSSTQAELSKIAQEKGIGTASMKCCCPSEVVKFVSEAARAKEAKV